MTNDMTPDKAREVLAGMFELLDRKRINAEQRVATLEATLSEALGLIKYWYGSGCPDCHGDCHSANPPMIGCIVQDTHTFLAKHKEPNHD